jgi:hypothetical protein
MAASIWARLNALFHMPFVRDMEAKVLIATEIAHAVFTVSYARHGEINEAYAQEAVNASVAYLRLYLPERVELREEHAAAVARGEQVVLLYGEPADEEEETDAAMRN